MGQIAVVNMLGKTCTWTSLRVNGSPELLMDILGENPAPVRIGFLDSWSVDFHSYPDEPYTELQFSIEFGDMEYAFDVGKAGLLSGGGPDLRPGEQTDVYFVLEGQVDPAAAGSPIRVNMTVRPRGAPFE